MTDTEQQASLLVRTMRELNLTFSSCESLTGGLFGATVTAIPGASQVYRGGVISYATDSKHSIVGVDLNVLETEGAVSRTTADQMALGARKLFGSDVGLSLTGVAGPDTQEDKPVGLVYCSVSFGEESFVKEWHFSPHASRQNIRFDAVSAAISLLVSLVGTFT